MNEKVTAMIHNKNLKYVKRGVIWAIIAGAMYGIGPTFQTLALQNEPLLSSSVLSIMLVPLIMACLQDWSAAIMVFIKNFQAGKHKEYLRVLKTKPGRFVILASFFGGPLALGTYMAAVVFCGPVYSIIITAVFPAIGAVISRIFLKEKIVPRGMIGILLAIAGSIVISWIPPTGDAYPHFYLGVALALVTAVGWSLEIVTSVAGMDFIDPEIVLGLRFFISGGFSFLVLPIVSGMGLVSWNIFFSTIPTMAYVWIIGGAFFAGFSYFFYYKAGNACGASRAMAINATYTITATLMGLIFWGTALQANFYFGLIILLTGIVLVVGKPSDLFTLRDFD